MSVVDPGILSPITANPAAEAEVIAPPPPISVRRRPLSIDLIVIPTETVIIGGVAYEMFSIDMFGPSMQQKVILHWNQINEILQRIYANLEDATTDDDAELDLAYNNFFSIIIPAAAAVIKSLYLSQKRRLYDHFLECHTETKILLGEITREEGAALSSALSSESLSTGETSSPDSNASTDATIHSAG